MRRTIATACMLAMISGAAWAEPSAVQTPPPHKTQAAKKRHKASRKKTVQAAAPAQQVPAQTLPPVPATLMNSPPVKPNVMLESGMLTIDAPNSTLSDVLSGVRQATGAEIEGASPSERVAVRLGPGKPEQVLSALLRGTPYDYVILGALGKPNVVTRVLLTQSSPSNESVNQATGAGLRSQPPPQQPAEDVPERSDEVATQPNADGQPEQAQPQQQPQPDESQKTPEQLLKELQQMDQQKQPR